VISETMAVTFLRCGPRYPAPPLRGAKKPRSMVALKSWGSIA